MINREKISRFLMQMTMGVLLLPLFQESFTLIFERNLKGAIIHAKKPFSLSDNWLNGTYQDSFELWQNENFGFRNTVVRLHNQLEYDFFNHPFADGVVIGKNDFLYEMKYINAYTGKDYLGESVISEITRKIRQIQDTLASRNITLVVALAPGKASFYPEYVPDDLLKDKQISNYQTFSKTLVASGVNCIDYNNWFLQLKEKTTCPLFPKTGIHWSRYGSIVACDSLIHYLEKKRNLNMPSVVIKGIKWSDSIHSPDDDIGQAMNLLFPVPPNLMAYPDYNFESPDGKDKVKMMVIGDSFFWNLFDIRLAPRSFESIDFWYYNQEIYHTDGRKTENAADADDCLETEHNDVVLLMASEANLSGLGWGYIDDAYDYFVLKNKDRIKNKLVRIYETSIKMDQAWMMTIKAKADANKISVDSMIHLDAIYLSEQKLKK